MLQKKQYGWVGGKDLGSFTIETAHGEVCFKQVLSQREGATLGGLVTNSIQLTES